MLTLLYTNLKNHPHWLIIPNKKALRLAASQKIAKKFAFSFDLHYLCNRNGVSRWWNDTWKWLFQWNQSVTSEEMVVGLPHSMYRHWLQTTLCCFRGNTLVVSDNWKPPVRLARWVTRRRMKMNRLWSIVSKVSRSHQNQGLFSLLG